MGRWFLGYRRARDFVGKMVADHRLVPDRRAALTAAEFAAADPDKDGTPSKDEYLKVAEQRFKRANPDNDGTLDEKELARVPAGRCCSYCNDMPVGDGGASSWWGSP